MFSRYKRLNEEMKKELKYNSVRPLPYYMCDNAAEENAFETVWK